MCLLSVGGQLPFLFRLSFRTPDQAEGWEPVFLLAHPTDFFHPVATRQNSNLEPPQSFTQIPRMPSIPR